MKPLQINFKPSPVFTLMIFALGLGATTIILMLPALQAQIKLLLLLVIVATAAYHICHNGLQLLPWSCIALNINSRNQLQILHRNGRLVSVEVCHNTVVTPYLSVINCKIHDVNLFMRLLGKRVLILPDMLSAEDYRQLRVWLRWGKPGKQRPTQP